MQAWQHACHFSGIRGEILWSLFCQVAVRISQRAWWKSDTLSLRVNATAAIIIIIHIIMHLFTYYFMEVCVLGSVTGKAAMDVCSPVNFLTGSALAERCNHELVWYSAHYWFALITSWSDVWIHRGVCWSWKRFPKRKESLGKSWWTRGSFVLKESPIWVLEMCFFS